MRYRAAAVGLLMAFVPTQVGASPAQLACIKRYESGVYTRVSKNRLHYGAYQFKPGTWDAVAKRHGFDHLVGVRPDRAHPIEQDGIAAHLLAEQGFRHWSVKVRRNCQ